MPNINFTGTGNTWWVNNNETTTTGTLAQMHAQILAQHQADQLAMVNLATMQADVPQTTQVWPSPQIPVPNWLDEDEPHEDFHEGDNMFLVDAHQIKPNEHIYSSFYKYPNMKLNKAACTQYEKAYPTQRKYDFVDKSAIIGIEIEVENITHTNIPLQCYWTMKNDGSLRNNGYEFVSIPLRADQIESAVSHVKHCILATNSPHFSNRTSIHIHLNCRDMTQDQLWNLVILYSIFEKHFYNFAGTRRLNSIFCVPIYRTNILTRLNDSVYRLAPHWSKYCGINLLPMTVNQTTGCYGTVEFRHLFGTLNEKALYDWINQIMCIRKAAMSMSKEQLLKEISVMNTTSSYIQMYNNIFRDQTKLLKEKDDFEECISNVKKELWGDTYSNNLAKTDQSKYWITHKLLCKGSD